jgi:hypothetical protein
LVPVSSGSDIEAEQRAAALGAAPSRASTCSLHRANGNANFTDHSHDGSSEQSHQSPHLVSQHPLSKSRLPLAYPPANSPTFQSISSSSHTPAYNSVMNSRTARSNSTFRSSVRKKGVLYRHVERVYNS